MKIAARFSVSVLVCVFAVFVGCSSGRSQRIAKNSDPGNRSLDYRALMRDFVVDIAAVARLRDEDFIVVPQNGGELITTTGDADGKLAASYLNAINGMGREDLFYGYTRDNRATPEDDKRRLLGLALLAESFGVQVLVTDYCSTPVKMDDSYAQNQQYGFISFAADSRELDGIPSYPMLPFRVNISDIRRLSHARNFLYLINPDGFSTKDEYISALAATDYDMIIMDLFFEDQTLNAQDLARLEEKSGGGQRLLLCYMSIGEAEDYRYYWQSSWNNSPPDWLAAENPQWKGNYKVSYWKAAWQQLILGSHNSYLSRILDAGFDGVYLDIVDAYEFFENGL